MQVYSAKYVGSIVWINFKREEWENKELIVLQIYISSRVASLLSKMYVWLLKISQTGNPGVLIYLQTLILFAHGGDRIHKK